LTAPCSTQFRFFTTTITLATMSDKRFAKRRTGFRASQRIAEAILDYVGQTPATTEDWNRKPAARARAIARRAAGQAAVTAGSLTLPPGPLGWLTLLPELRALWKLQTQMVADIAGCHGKTAVLGREEMLYCLFRHTDPQAVRDLVSQIGNRFVVQRAARPETPVSRTEDRAAHLATSHRQGAFTLDPGVRRAGRRRVRLLRHRTGRPNGNRFLRRRY
jgi:hypothetical protein